MIACRGIPGTSCYPWQGGKAAGGDVLFGAPRERKELVLNDRIIVHRVAVDFIIIHGLTIKGVITEVQRIFGEIIIADILKQDKDIFPGVHNIHGVILDLKGRGGAFSIVGQADGVADLLENIVLDGDGGAVRNSVNPLQDKSRPCRKYC